MLTQIYLQIRVQIRVSCNNALPGFEMQSMGFAEESETLRLPQSLTLPVNG